MIDLKTYNRLKAAVDEKQREADRAAGAFDQAMARLKKDFGCETIEEAKEKLASLERKEEAARQAFEAELKKFQQEWSHVLSIT